LSSTHPQVQAFLEPFPMDVEELAPRITESHR
jgi:hypothetical protein